MHIWSAQKYYTHRYNIRSSENNQQFLFPRRSEKPKVKSSPRFDYNIYKTPLRDFNKQIFLKKLL